MPSSSDFLHVSTPRSLAQAGPMLSPPQGAWRPPRSPNLLLENCLLVGPRLFERLSHEALHFEFVKDSRDVRRGIAEGWGAAEGRSPSARDLVVIWGGPGRRDHARYQEIMPSPRDIHQSILRSRLPYGTRMGPFPWPMISREP
jgi:hypothetical protein